MDDRDFEATVGPTMVGYWKRAAEELKAGGGKVYKRVLRRFSQPAVMHALDVAYAKSPRWLPSAKELAEYAEDFDRSRRRAATREESESPSTFWRNLWIKNDDSRRNELTAASDDEIELMRLCSELKRAAVVYGPNTRILRSMWAHWSNAAAQRRGDPERWPSVLHWNEGAEDAFRRWARTACRRVLGDGRTIEPVFREVMQ